MKKKILALFVTFLTAALLTVPVMGKQLPAKKFEVTLTVESILIPDPASAHFADHNIVHNKGMSIGNVTLIIPGEDDYTGPDNNMYATWSGTSWWTDMPTYDPEARNVIRTKLVFTFTGGTFEGVGHIKSIGLPPFPQFESYAEYRYILQGTGEFKGQTLKLSYAGANPVVALSGTLIKPK